MRTRFLFYTIAALAGFGSTAGLAILFWAQQGSNNPYLFWTLVLFNYLGLIGMGYEMGRDEQSKATP